MARRKTDGKMLSCKKCKKPLRSSIIIKPSTWKHECSECCDRYYCGTCIGKWRGTPVCDKCYKGLDELKITEASDFVGYKIVNEHNLIIIDMIFTLVSKARDEMTKRAFRMGANAITNFKILERKHRTETWVHGPAEKNSPGRFMPRRSTTTYYEAQGMAVTLQKSLRRE